MTLENIIKAKLVPDSTKISVMRYKPRTRLAYGDTKSAFVMKYAKVKIKLMQYSEPLGTLEVTVNIKED